MTESIRQLGPTADVQVSLPPAPVATSPERQWNDLLEQQKAVLAMGRRAIAAPDLAVLMQDAAALLAEVLGTQYSLVAELANDGHSEQLTLTLHEGAGPTQRCYAHRTSPAAGDSLAGYALQVAQPVVVTDLPQDKRFTDALLSKHAIRSAVAVPLKLQDRSFGSLAACSSQERTFNEEELQFVETVAHLVSSAIGRARAEKALADERRLATRVLQTVDALVLVLDARGQIVSINPACERLTGFSLDEIKGRQMWNVTSAPDQADTCQRLLGSLQGEKSLAEFESCLLTKHSQQRHVAWSCSAITAGDGTPEWIIATGIDITEQRRAQEEAERAVRAAEQARQVMARALLAAERSAGQSRVGRTAGPPPAGDRETATPPTVLPPHVPTERRRHPRRTFPYKQRIALVLDGVLPDRDSFMDVQCKDIAASGFSFLSPTAPASDTLAVALGVAPEVTYLVAQVVHVTPSDKRGRQEFVVGCKYVGRAAYPE